jgi:hypothetical protein
LRFYLEDLFLLDKGGREKLHPRSYYRWYRLFATFLEGSASPNFPTGFDNVHRGV